MHLHAILSTEQSFLNKLMLTPCMGRIKTTLVKRVTNNMFSENANRFTTSFEENKAVVEQLANLPSKKIRNIIAGYATRLKKKQEATAL